ncbi:hypothetical protein CVT25_002986 [Psilocybe cyanescens]|uniref:Uncharacterized protein n=1 Tax=Psilocybe cyanescens TaxID=93625 RepID=A0A409WMV9_PSICY|nr:hypothetical protein CVT25_002986 [Psilocybe cyanescens]
MRPRRAKGASNWFNASHTFRNVKSTPKKWLKVILAMEADSSESYGIFSALIEFAFYTAVESLLKELYDVLVQTMLKQM